MNNLILSELPVVRTGAEAVLLDMGGGIGCVSFRSKGNSVSPPVREFMTDVVEHGLYDFDGLVIANEGKHYSVGANLSSMKEKIDRKEFAGFADQAFQKAVITLRRSKKPIVSAPYKTTLGGGLEVVLHTHARAALQKSFLGLVEVGVGLIPGGGGTKESALLVGAAPAAQRDEVLKTTFRKLITRAVSKDAEDARAMGYLAPRDPVCPDQEQLPAQAKALCLSLVKSGFRTPEPPRVTLPGRRGWKLLCTYIEELLAGGDISPYDAEIGRQLAVVLCGSDTEDDVERTEDQLLKLENDCFVNLIKSPGTYARISYFLEHNELLRN